MGTTGRRWAKKIRLIEKDQVFRDAKSLALWLEVDVSMVYKALRGTIPAVSGYHVEWVE